MNFDPSEYLDASTTSASERRQPIPAGEYTATISNLEVKQWESKTKIDPQTGAPLSGIRFDITLAIDLPSSIAEASGLSTPVLTLTDGVMIDRTADGAINYAPGRNGRLRQYRDATGLNTAGQPFSPRMLVGRLVKARITHEEYNGNIMERIGGVAKAV